MKIRVERCFGGKFRLTTPKGEREFIRAESWTRAVATEALNLYQYNYHLKRSSIRFVHV